MSLSAEPIRASAALRGGKVEGLAFLLVTACSWGFNWPIAKFLLSELPPFSMRCSCCLLGAAFGFGLARARGELLRVPAGGWPLLLVYATLNFGAFTVLTTLSLVWLKASEAVVITYTVPIWASLLAWPMLGERPTIQRLAAMLLAFAGVALLVGADGISASGATLPGVFCGFLAATLFGLGTVVAKRAPLEMPPIAGVAWQALLGSTPLLLLALFEHPAWPGVTPLGWAGIAYTAVLPMTIAYLAWFRALRLLPASIAATSVLVSPLIGVLASAALLDDPLGPRQLLALALTLTGVGLAVRS